MTQNEVSIIKNAVLDATEAYVDARLGTADFVKTQIGVVISAIQTSAKKWVHTVRCNSTPTNPSGITYNNVLSVNNIHFEDDSVVFILAPNAQYSNQFILGKLDNVPYDIVGGSIDIGNGQFIVDRDGNVACNGDIVCHNIIADTTGSIAGFKIGQTIWGTNKTLSVADTLVSPNIIGCGEAGYGVINMVGGSGSNGGYIQISTSGNPYECRGGIRIYHNGTIRAYNDQYTETWSRNLSDIPTD